MKTLTQHHIGYESGLDKLASTAEMVKKMQRELESLQPNLVRAQKDADELMKVIATESVTVQAQREVVAQEEAVANEKAMAAKKIRDECERCVVWFNDISGWLVGWLGISSFATSVYKLYLCSPAPQRPCTCHPDSQVR